MTLAKNKVKMYEINLRSLIYNYHCFTCLRNRLKDMFDRRRTPDSRQM